MRPVASSMMKYSGRSSLGGAHAGGAEGVGDGVEVTDCVELAVAVGVADREVDGDGDGDGDDVCAATCGRHGPPRHTAATAAAAIDKAAAGIRRRACRRRCCRAATSPTISPTVSS